MHTRRERFPLIFLLFHPVFYHSFPPTVEPLPPGGGVVLGPFGWGCAAGILEPYTIPDLVQLNFATLY